MSRKITATITFELHDDLDKELDEALNGGNDLYANQRERFTVERYLKDSLEDERVGAANFNTLKVKDVVITFER
jgi:hypothetical protein